MSFARNFALGQQIGKGLVDTYDSGRQQKEFEDIQKATREDSQGYSEADLNRLRQFAQAKNEDGEARYTMDPGADGGFNVRANTAYQGDDGLTVPQGMAMGVQPQRMSTFLGQQYGADELSPERMEGLRNRAMAGVISKTDPIRGMALQQQIKAGERDDQLFKNQQIDFGNKQTQFGRETKTYEDAEALKTGRKAEVQRLQALKPEELADALGGEFSKDGSGVDAMLAFDPKSNKYVFASKIPGIPTQVLSRAELLQYGMGVWEQGNGDYAAGLRQVLDTTKAQREIQNTNFTRSSALAKGDADLYQFGVKSDQDNQGLEIKKSLADAQVGYYGQRGETGSLREFVNKEGQSVLVDISKLPRGNDGTVTMPIGLKPKTAKPEFSPQAYAATIKDFTQSGMTPTEARIEADQLFGQGPATGVQDSNLQILNKGKDADKKPVIVRPGEVGMRASGQPVMGDPGSFRRVSERGLFGGISYGYQDPVTGKKYSTEEYNRLLAN
jgi:hypothetical protein